MLRNYLRSLYQDAISRVYSTAYEHIASSVTGDSLVLDCGANNGWTLDLIVFSYRVLGQYLRMIGFVNVTGRGFGLYPFPRFAQSLLERLDPYHCHQMVFVATKSLGDVQQPLRSCLVPRCLAPEHSTRPHAVQRRDWAAPPSSFLEKYVRFSELVRLLEEAGFRIVKEKGSIRYYAKPGWDKLIRVDYHGAKEVPTGTCHSILKDAGIKHP